MDALKGHHQCPLDEKLTTFITPFGQFKYLRAPYGICSISEHYNQQTDEALAGLKDFHKIVDDVIIFNQDEQEYIEHVSDPPTFPGEEYITEQEQIRFHQTEVPFVGVKLTRRILHQ